MNKLLTPLLLVVISGCTSHTKNAQHDLIENVSYEQLASKVISIRHLKVEEDTEVALLTYLNAKNELCTQWVQDARKIHDDLETTIAVHCGAYEIRSTGAEQETYISTDIKAIEEITTLNGLVIQRLNM